jgi:hypothetical protein
MFRIKKKSDSLKWRFLRVIFSNGITEGFKTAAPYGDVTGSPFKMPTELPRDSKRQIRTVTCPFCRQNSRQTHRQNMSIGETVGKS